jgi:Peptidase M15
MTREQLELLDAADAICRRYPASVTSWWRSARHNASLPGSVPNSQHQLGLAIDLVFDGPEPSKAELAPFLSRTMQDVRSEPGHVHLEQDPRLLARSQRPAVGTVAASVTSSPSSSVQASGPTLSPSSSALASGSAPAAAAPFQGPRAGPGSSPIDRLFKGRG